jgi:hypothetical protein
MSFRRNREVFLVSHSQIVKTRHPDPTSLRAFRRSRFLLPLSLGSQKLSLDFGRRASLHRGCRCQKQPCTKITLWSRLNTISGHPGKDFWWSRYLKPSPKIIFLTSISGLVSLGRMSAIRLLLSILLIVSMCAHSSHATILSGIHFASFEVRRKPLPADTVSSLALETIVVGARSRARGYIVGIATASPRSPTVRTA